MLSVLEAQNAARRDPDQLIRNFMRNNYEANLISAEMKTMPKFFDARIEIEKQITKPILREDLARDWENMLDGKARGGLKIIDFFTRVERLDTKGKNGISFYEFIKDPKLKPSQLAFMTKLEAEDPNSNEIQRLWQIFKFEHNSIAAFPPSQMIYALEKYKPNVILDPTMGWGGRLLGACALGATQYIGIDSNTDLVLPYHNLKTYVDKMNSSKTHLSLMFRDCLSLDYSTLKYDCVFSSPPYYNIEQYANQPQLFRTKTDWNELFYRPLVTRTYDGLAENGTYALNVSPEIFGFIKTILGKPTEIVPLKKGDFFRNNQYREYIYIWVKPPNVQILEDVEDVELIS